MGQVHSRRGAINVKALVIVGVVIVVLGAGAFAGHKIRKRKIAEDALAAGLAAYEQAEWAEASRQLRRYLERYPKDNDILEKYCESTVSVTPFSARRIGTAIANYRRLLRLDPGRESVYGQLARLYKWTGNFSELSYVAQKRLERWPEDREAVIWLAQAYLGQMKFGQVRETLEPYLEKMDKTTDKHDEYVRACGLLSESILQESVKSGRDRRKDALGWLTKACEYDPLSGEALVNRARFYLLFGAGPGEDRTESYALSRADVEVATDRAVADPRIRLKLSQVWMELGELDKAESVFEAIGEPTAAELSPYYLDPLDWLTARFVHGAELKVRRKATEEAGALADESLAKLTAARVQTVVLPPAVQLYLLAGRVEDARKCLSDYVDAVGLRSDAQKSSRRLAILRAMVAQAEKKYYEVIEQLEPLAAGSAPHANVWALLAEAYSHTGQGRRSADAIRKYLKIRPMDRNMSVQLVREQIKLGQWRGAWASARSAEELDPEDLTIKLMRIEAGILVATNRSAEPDQGQLESLGKELDALRQAHPKSVQVRVLRSQVAERLGQSEVAEKTLRAAIEESESPLIAELRLAKLFYSSGRLAEAIKVARKACETHGSEMDPWAALADLHQADGDYEAALATLERGQAAVSDPSDQRELVFRGAILNILHADRPAGIDQLRKMAAEDQNSVRFRRFLLDLKEVRADRAEADKLVKEIRDIEGESGLIWRLARAALWMQEKGWRDRQQEIRESLEHCIAGDPQWSGPVLLLGRLFERLADMAEAESTYRRGLEANPGSIQVADRLTALLRGQRRFGEAKALLDQVEADSKTLSARRVRAALGTGEVSEAIEMLRLRVAENPKDVNSQVLLARLLYRSTKDSAAALKQLDEAESKGAPSLSTLAARVAILKTEGRQEEARSLLDDAVGRDPSFEAYFLRAMYLSSTNDLAGAEKDYQHLLTFKRQGHGYDLLGRFYLETNQLDQAISAWEKGQAAYPENSEISRGLMKALLARGGKEDRPRAEALLAKLEGEREGDVDLMRTRARLYLAEGTREARQKAEDLLKRIVKAQPTAVDAHLQLIGLAAKQSNFTRVRDLAVQALGPNPDHPTLTLARAQAELSLNNTNVARELVRIVLDADPDRIEALDLLAKVAAASKDEATVTHVIKKLDEALVRLPESAEPLHVARARLLTGIGRSDAAIAELEGYVGSDAGSGSLSAYLGLVELYLTRHDLAKASAALEKAGAIEPEHPGVIRARMVFLGQNKKFDQILKMVASHRTKRQADPQVLLTAVAMLGAAPSTKYQKEALALAEGVLAEAPGRVDAKLAIATISLKLGDLDRTAEMYGQILEASPRNITVLNNMANILSEVRGDHVEALKLAERALDTDPNNVHVQDTYGMILMRLGRLKEARVALEKCVALASATLPTGAKARLRLASVEVKLGRPEDARKSLETAKRLGEELGVFGEKEKATIKEIERALAL